MTRQMEFSKRRLLKYFSMIARALEESGELDDYEDSLVDVLTKPGNLDSVSTTSDSQLDIDVFKHSSVDTLIELKLYSPTLKGWQLQARKQDKLERCVREQIEHEKPEDHLRRFTRSFTRRDTAAEEPPSPVSIEGNDDSESSEVKPVSVYTDKDGNGHALQEMIVELNCGEQLAEQNLCVA